MDKETYVRFANHLSMMFLQDGEGHHTYATMPADLEAIVAINTSNPRLREVQQICKKMRPEQIKSYSLCLMP